MWIVESGALLSPFPPRPGPHRPEAFPDAPVKRAPQRGQRGIRHRLRKTDSPDADGGSRGWLCVQRFSCSIQSSYGPERNNLGQVPKFRYMERRTTRWCSYSRARASAASCAVTSSALVRDQVLLPTLEISASRGSRWAAVYGRSETAQHRRSTCSGNQLCSQVRVFAIAAKSRCVFFLFSYRTPPLVVPPG